MNNPFTLSFGKKPLQFISRISQTREIIDTFQSDNPSSQIYMLTGVRGSGKTVMMTTISSELSKDDSWICIELNPTMDILQSLAAKLYTIPEMHTHFIKASIDLSLFGIGVSIENAIPSADIETAISKMLNILQKHKKKLLITIDEVVNNEYIKIFASSFQIFLRHDYPLYLIMTGLYDNIYELQNDKNLTFLYRAPKIVLEPLNYTAIRTSYLNIFHIPEETADEMAVLTKGYPFAYQVLGYLFWNDSKKNLSNVIPLLDQYLDEYVYSKIWSELSPTDKKIIRFMSSDDNKVYDVKEIRDQLKISSEKFSVYRDRLKRKGLINCNSYGKISLILPRFEAFVRNRYE
ncbi:MAG: ATP-binding protein [Lachnospiraceae bacterium]|nr:ATP-binding protein [Lachnospiraceae bacterium]